MKYIVELVVQTVVESNSPNNAISKALKQAEASGFTESVSLRGVEPLKKKKEIY